MRELTERLDDLVAGRYWDRAEQLLLSELDRANARGDDSLALSLESELMGLYRMSGNESGFFSSMDNARALLRRTRIDRRSRGTILINIATGLTAFSRSEESLPVYREAERLFREVLPPGDTLFAALYNNMSSAYRDLGDCTEAETCLRRAEQILCETPHHPDLATTLVNLAQVLVLRDSGRERADEALDRAWAVFDDPETVWNGYYAHTALKCAGAFEELGQGERAKELRERADLIYERT